MVEFDRVWEINTKEDYERAMNTLKENEFIANMSDDFFSWRREIDEVARQRAMIRKQAMEKDILKEVSNS